MHVTCSPLRGVWQCGTEGPCSELTQNIVPTMNSACCQDASDCSESGFPLRCSQACAEIYLPVNPLSLSLSLSLCSLSRSC